MPNRAYSFVWRLILSLLLATTGAWGAAAETAIDVTGYYSLPWSCSSGDVEDGETLGGFYLAHCFKDIKCSSAFNLQLVQNEKKTCGSYSSCNGSNCRRVESGKMVGSIDGKEIELFVEDRHRESGDASIEKYLAVPGGLGTPGRRDNKPLYVRRTPILESPSSIQSCDPILQQSAKLKDYQLEITGMPHEEIKFKIPAEKLTPPPASRQIRLSDVKSTFRWLDKRNGDNQVSRSVTVLNNTSREWTISAEHSEVCNDYLKGLVLPVSTGRVKKISSFDIQSGFEVAPTSEVPFLSCKDSTFYAEQQVSCPNFFCLEGCKC